MKTGYVYILFNKPNGTLYTGVTSNLVKRIHEHKSKAVEGFTGRYHVDKLGFYEICETIEGAIAREKQIKAGSRVKKIALIQGMNPTWRDLWEDIVGVDCFG
jgi:putative endonuclease